ncbi:VOC family protein [Streptomyces sp. NPDC005438]|uniref:VOC family protein n=1 Tax=Streptomyces sp. NPDC005438 TaxID=3156880 RepID=UPI0033B66330
MARKAFTEGEPCWVEATVPDEEAARRFYGELFGWSFAPLSAVGHGSLARLRGRPVAALTRKPDGRMPTTWNLYLATRDVADTLERIQRAGGQALGGPTAVGDFGLRAPAADPGGAVFTLWQPGVHAGFGTTEEPGAYLWAEVHTRKPARVDAFYTAVFGYGLTTPTRPGVDGAEPPAVVDEEGDTLAGSGDAERAAPYLFGLWTPEGAPLDPEYAVLGRCVMGPEEPAPLPPYLLTYFEVEDCAATARRVVELGGRVRFGPESTPFGELAVVADDQGAVFAVMSGTADPGEGAGSGAAEGEGEGSGDRESADGVDRGESAEDLGEAEGAGATEGAGALVEPGAEDGWEGGERGEKGNGS